MTLTISTIVNIVTALVILAGIIVYWLVTLFLD